MSTPNQPKLTFGKNERLKSRSTIDSLFIQNNIIRIYPFKLVWITNEFDLPHIEVGVSVSKRIFKAAVKRNFIKRRMRECYRLNKMLLYKKIESKNIKISFMLIYVGNNILPYNEFNTKIKQLLIRLGDIIDKEND
ncbi:MAG: ribonuclease P protein component [Salinivirgaceae bacterium]|nr:ribonuclease P protein component [Salinivirgaceae bacterium]